MVKRNDPCPCGSGKKYKKCCDGKAQVTSEVVFYEEIENTLQTFYTTYPERKDIQEFITLADSMLDKLGSKLQRELIEAVALDEYFFHHRLDIWKGYLKRTAKKMVRPSTIELLKNWKSPTLFFGTVLDVEEQYFTATNIFNGENVKIRREVNKPIPVGMGTFCFLLPDGSGVADQMLAVSSLIFFPIQYGTVLEKFGKDFSLQSELSSIEFGKKHHIDIWEALVAAGYTGEEFTTFEQEVLEQTKQFLSEHERNAERLLVALEDYLVDQQPTARKAAAIAAGAIRYGQERELFDGKPFTVKEIAESFGISASSLNKYYQELLAYTTVTA